MRKYTLYGISILCISIIIFQFSGCDESNITETVSTQTISGKVMNIWGEPISNIKVSTDSDLIYTDSEGNFVLSNVIVPYTLFLSYDSDSHYVVLPNLTTNVIRYVMDLATNQYSYNTCHVNISADSSMFDEISGGRYIISDQEYINNSDFASISNSITVRMGDKTHANARIYFLGYKKENNRINQYEKFGYKDISLNSGTNVNVNFENSDITFNPDETEISGEFVNTSGNNIIQFYYLQFGNYHSPNYITHTFFERMDTKKFNYVVPANLPVPFHLLVYYYNTGTTSSGYLQKKLLPGSTNNIFPVQESPVLISPQNGGSNITLSTPFEFSTDGSESIYRLLLRTDNKKYYIYTKNSGINLEALSNFNFSLISGQTYSWTVERLGRFNSVNDFATESQVLERSRTFTNAVNNFIGS